ncbi:MAG: DoxX family protein [Actinomycetota bacterium]
MVVVASSLLALALGLGFLCAGYAKITQQPVMIKAGRQLGVPAATYRLIGGAEIAGAIGLAFGLVFTWIGVAAAFGLLALMVSAIGVHLHVDDQLHELVPAGTLALLIMVYLAVIVAG